MSVVSLKARHRQNRAAAGTSSNTDAPRRTMQVRLRSISLLLSLSAIGWAGSETPAVVIEGRPLTAAELDAGVKLCRRDLPERTLAHCFEEFIVPLHRLEREARRRKLADSNGGRKLSAAILHEALWNQLEGSVEVSERQVRDYIDHHKRDFQRPLRVRLFRILVGSEAEATRLLTKLTPDTTPAEFRALCREHSQDAATLERGGDLGFVWPDGSTDVPQLRTEESLYLAAQPLPDGAFVPHAVKEKDQFAVVWRRGSLPAIAMPKEEADDLARSRLIERATQAELTRIVSEADAKVYAERLATLRQRREGTSK